MRDPINHTELARQASSAEKSGEYDRASELYFKSAGERIGSYLWTDREDGSNGNLALADLLRAVYCARRGDEDERAENIGLVYEGTASVLQTTTDLRDAKGVIEELVGDCYLLLERETAVDHYQQATTQYELLSNTMQLSWGMEPEFVHAQWVVDDYINWVGIDLDDQFGINTSISSALSDDFSERIKLKIEISKRSSTGL